MTKLISALAFTGFSLVLSVVHAGFPPPDEMLCYEDCAQTHSHEYCLDRYYGATEELKAVGLQSTEVSMQNLECRTQNADQVQFSGL